MVKKKSNFWTFIFSFMPGAAEMYMGFMKMGVSLMTAFIAILAISTLLEIGPLLFLALVVWFYGFFHARNLAHLDEMELQQVEDHYLFVNEEFDTQKITSKYRKLFAAVLILLGVAVLWNNLMNFLYSILPSSIAYDYVREVGYAVPRLAVAVLVIVIGVKMIAGKKEELEHDESSDDQPEA